MQHPGREQACAWLLHRLATFPAAACTLRLALLDLTDNSLAGLPPELGRMTTLRALPLSGNPIKGLRTQGPLSALLASLRNRLPVRAGRLACSREHGCMHAAVVSHAPVPATPAWCGVPGLFPDMLALMQHRV